MKRYRMAVCKGPDCRRGGSDAVFQAARAEVQERGLATRCEVYRGGCYGLCDRGPNVVVREDVGRKKDPLSREDYQLMGWDGEAYYGHMSVEKIRRVVAEHVACDAPVPELFGSPEPEPEAPAGPPLAEAARR